MIDRMELMLARVADEIEFPDTPPISSRVAERIRLVPSPAPAPIRWIRPVLVAAVLVAAVAFTLAFSPAARRAAADLLGIVGIRISVGDGVDAPPPPSSPTDELKLGERIPLQTASGRAGFAVKVPRVPGLGTGAPAAYFDGSIGRAGMISLVYPSRASRYADVDVLISQFEASVDEGFFKKIAGAGGRVRFTEVGGGPGYWVSGEPHLFFYVDPGDGSVRTENIRMAGNVLLWEADGITYRIEGPASLAEAHRLAEALR